MKASLRDALARGAEDSPEHRALARAVGKASGNVEEAKRRAANFRASISESGYASFGARVGKHDDLVLALALAVWWLTGGAARNAYTVEPLSTG